MMAFSSQVSLLGKVAGLLGRTVAFASSVPGRLLLGVLACSTVVMSMEVGRHFEQLQVSVAWMPATLGILVTFCLISVRAARWNMLLRASGAALPLRRLASIYGSSFFLGLVSPGKIGEISRVWMVRRDVGGIAPAAVSVVVDRAFDLVSTLMLVGVFGTLVSIEGYETLSAVLRTLCILAAVGLAVTLGQPRVLQTCVYAVTARLLRRISSQTKDCQPDDIHVGFRPSTLLGAAGLSLFSQALALVQIYLFAQAVQISLNPISIYAVVTMATIIASLPLSVAGIGTREAAVILSLVAMGVDSEQAFAFSILWLVNFLVMLATSFLFFVNRPRDPVLSKESRVALTSPE